MPNKIIIGRLNAPYGLKGWIKLESFTDPKINICAYPEGWLQYPRQTAWQPYQATIKQLGKNLLIKFPDCENPEIARKLTGAVLAVEREQLPQLTQDDYYWSDLEGLRVVTESNIPLGTLAYFIATGANDVMVVKDSEKERLIPYIDDVVIKVDIQHQQIVVHWDPEF